jgi:hypothetical protein
MVSTSRQAGVRKASKRRDSFVTPQGGHVMTNAELWALATDAYSPVARLNDGSLSRTKSRDQSSRNASSSSAVR